jgi:hypothetical protein
MPTQTVTFTQRSWEQMVREADGPDYQREHDHPEVYVFSKPAKPRRDPGADGGPYG